MTAVFEPLPTAQLDPQPLLRAMTDVGRCTSPSLSPSGRRIACIADRTGIPQVWVDGLPVTASQHPVTNVLWSPSGERIAFTVAPGGSLNTQVWSARPDGTAARRLTDGGPEHNRLLRWTRDGSAVMVTSNRVRADHLDAYLVDAYTGEHRLVAQGNPLALLLDVSGDGHHAVVRRVHYRGDDDLVVVDLRTGGERLLTPHEPPATFPVARFHPDGRTIYLVSDRDREHAALARVRLRTRSRVGALEVVAARIASSLATFELSRDGRTAALVWESCGRSELAFADLPSGTVRPGPPLAGDVIGAIDLSADGSKVAFELSGPDAPPNVWTWERAETPPQPVVAPATIGTALVRPELVRFPAHDGLPLTGWLYRPPGSTAPGPLVLSFHGGPEDQERPCFSPLYQALAAAGVAVFAPNVRGSSGYGRTFVNLDNGPLRFDAIRDVESCLQAVVALGFAAPGRVGIMGRSYGGYLTMAALVAYPGQFAAAANIYGVVNFETFFATTEPWMARLSTRKYGDPATEAELLRALSPIHALNRVCTPTIVLHGANDTNVPVLEAEQVVAALGGNGIPVEYLLFAGEGHGFARLDTRLAADTALVGWFTRHLR